jgi:hypothetical protein
LTSTSRGRFACRCRQRPRLHSPDSRTVTSAHGTGRQPYFAARETHSAIVLFTGDLAHKIKKPVDLGFLDFRTEPARLAVCHRRVELNLRLAPDVYLLPASGSTHCMSGCRLKHNPGRDRNQVWQCVRGCDRLSPSPPRDGCQAAPSGRTPTGKSRQRQSGMYSKKQPGFHPEALSMITRGRLDQDQRP